MNGRFGPAVVAHYSAHGHRRTLVHNSRGGFNHAFMSSSFLLEVGCRQLETKGSPRLTIQTPYEEQVAFMCVRRRPPANPFECLQFFFLKSPRNRLIFFSGLIGQTLLKPSQPNQLFKVRTCRPGPMRCWPLPRTLCGRPVGHGCEEKTGRRRPGVGQRGAATAAGASAGVAAHRWGRRGVAREG